jgi:phosphoglycerate dehydrogenase-like enzyme
MLTVLVAIYSRFPSWNIPDAYLGRLRRAFPDHIFLHAHSDAEALELMPLADVVFMSEMRPAQFALAERLQWLHSPAAGVGGMLFPEMLASPVVMTNSRGISADTIAEHVIAMTLAMFRRLPQAVHAQAGRLWAQDAMLLPPPIRMLQGSRALIVGLGGIGTATARRLSALGVTVRGVRRRADREPPPGIEQVFAADRLLDALPHADIVVLAAPQTRQTRGMFGDDALAAMQGDALLVNVSRGKLVDEKALAEALREGRIGGAALDVFEHEPLAPESALWTLPNVLITPHMSGFRPDHWEAVTGLFAENFRRFAHGEPLLNVVDKSEGY